MSNSRINGAETRLLPATATASSFEGYPVGSLQSRAAARSLVAERQRISKLGPFASLLASLRPFSPAESEALRKGIIAARARVGR
jgi:hypothetical protein